MSVAFRVFAQLLIAMAVMVLGYDALSALESGAVDPISLAELLELASGRLGGDLTALGLIDMAEGWPGALRTAWLVLVAGPAFLWFGLLGLILALVFRNR